ncbi:hypothetical protein BPO_0187 [Bergeyella porcorum]|uniref:Uncharacterized protein n=1 Tax=Bergeyella porcorum TaxID=1735111 RepID=A0AAU0EYY1_9FLAO
MIIERTPHLCEAPLFKKRGILNKKNPSRRFSISEMDALSIPKKKFTLNFPLNAER